MLPSNPAVIARRQQAAAAALAREASWARAAAMEPADWQALNGDLEDVVVTLDRGRGRTRVQTRQRAQDRRVLDAIEEVGSGQRAAIWLSVGYRAIVDGNMPRAQTLAVASVQEQGERRDPGDAAEFAISAAWGYQDWQAGCAALGFRAKAITDVLIWGAAFSTTDALYRRRKGWARQQTQRGLALFSALQGWESPAEWQTWGLSEADVVRARNARSLQQDACISKQTA